MKRPYVICHMAPSVDGKIITKRWSVSRAITVEYEKTAKTFGADAWLIGRISMQPYAGRTRVPKPRTGKNIRADFVADHDASSYAIAIDPSGKLAWKSGDIDGEHVITILSEQVSDDYLAMLRHRGVSYLFAGRTTLDLGIALDKLAALHKIRTVLLEGGGNVNGSFLDAGLIDELSVLVVPIADGSTATPTLFDTGRKEGPVRRLKLISATERSSDIVWLRYRVR